MFCIYWLYIPGKDTWDFIKIQNQIIQVEFMSKRLTQNDWKKEEAGQVLEHKDYYFLASVEILEQSEGRKIIMNTKHSLILTQYLYLFTIPLNIFFQEILIS